MVQSIMTKCYTSVNYPMSLTGFKGLEKITHVKERKLDGEEKDSQDILRNFLGVESNYSKFNILAAFLC